MKNKEKLVVGIVLAIILGIALYASFKEDTDKMIQTSTSTLSTKDNFKEAVMDGCMEGGEASYAYCSCAYDELSKTTTKSEMINMGLEYNNTGNIPQEMFDAASKCISLY
jgi:chlorite dismutase